MTEPQSDASLEELTSRAASRMATGSLQSSRPTTAPPDTSTSTSTAIPGTAIPPDTVTLLLSIAGESTFVGSVFTQSGSVANHPSGRGLPIQTNMVDPTEPNDHPILKVLSQSSTVGVLTACVCAVQAAGLPDRLRLVETAVMMNYMQNRLALYRNLPTLIGGLHPPFP